MELCYSFSISNDLTQMINFPTWIPDCDSHSLLFQIHFFLLTLVFALQWLSLYWEILNMLLFQFPLTFQINSKWDALFQCIAYDYSSADWDGLCDHLRDVPREDIFKFSASAAASEFCEWVQVGIHVYIWHCKYQVKPHSSPWFWVACAAAINHSNHFFICTNRINLLNLK